MEDSDKGKEIIAHKAGAKVEAVPTTAAESNANPTADQSTVSINKLTGAEEKIALEESDDEDSCPIEPFLEDSDKEEEIITPVKPVIVESAPVKASEATVKQDVDQLAVSVKGEANISKAEQQKALEESEDEDSCPIEPFLEDSEAEEAPAMKEKPLVPQQTKEQKMASTEILKLPSEVPQQPVDSEAEQITEEPSTKIMGILEKLTSIVNKNVDQIEAAVVSHFSKQLEDLENVSLDQAQSGDVVAAGITAGESDDDSCPIEPFLEDSDKEIDKIKHEVSEENIKEQNSAKANTAVTEAEQKEASEDEDDDSCPIEPFLEDSDKEIDVVTKGNIQEQSCTKVETSITEAEQKEANDDEDDDSCPIEPFLEDSDKEIYELKPEVTKVNIQDKSCTKVESTISTADQKEANVDEDDDSCPIEPFLEDSDNEIDEIKPEVTEKNNKEQNSSKANTAITEAEQKEANEDEDSCPIEPFLEDSDKEFEDSKVDQFGMLKSWADIAAKPVETESNHEAIEKKAAEQLSIQDLPNVVVVADDEKSTSDGDLVDPEGFKVVLNKKDRKRTRTVSGKDIAEAIKEVVKDIPVEQVAEDSMIQQTPEACQVQEVEQQVLLKPEPKKDDTAKKSGEIVQESVQAQEQEQPVSVVVPAYESGPVWAKVAAQSPIQSQVEDVVVEERGTKEEERLPEVLVMEEENEAKPAVDEVDGDGFKVVHSKKDRKRTRTVSLKSVEEATKLEAEKIESEKEEKRSDADVKVTEVKETVDEVIDELPHSWAKVAAATYVAPPAAEAVEEVSAVEVKETKIPEILIPDEETEKEIAETDKEGFQKVRTKKDRSRTRTLSLKSIRVDDVHEAEVDNSKQEKVKENNKEMPVQAVEPPEAQDEVKSVTTWASVAAQAPELVDIQVADESKPEHAAETKLPEIVVPVEAESEKGVDVGEAVDADGFKVVHGKKDRKRTRTLSLKSITEALKDVQSAPLEHSIDDKVDACLAEGAEEPDQEAAGVASGKHALRATEITPEQEIEEETVAVVKNTPACVVSQPPADQEGVTPVSKDVQFAIEAPGAAPNRIKKEASAVEADDATPDLETVIGPIEPAVIVTEAQVPKLESRKSETTSDSSNFRVAASRSPSVPAAKEIKPPDPYRDLSLETFWHNKWECEDAENLWQTSKATSCREVPAEESLSSDVTVEKESRGQEAIKDVGRQDLDVLKAVEDKIDHGPSAKSLETLLEQEMKPTADLSHLRFEKFWTNKLECEEAESRWQTLIKKKDKTSTAQASQNVVERHDDDDTDGHDDDGRRDGGHDDSDQFSKDCKTFSTVDTAEHHPSGKGNWTDESTYLSLDPVKEPVIKPDSKPVVQTDVEQSPKSGNNTANPFFARAGGELQRNKLAVAVWLVYSKSCT